MYTSAASYAIFKTRAWALLNQNAYVAAPMDTLADDLYDECYSQPNVNAAAVAKVALTDRPLVQKMTSICAEYEDDRRVWNQSLDADLDIEDLGIEYANRAWYLGTNCLTRLFCCCGIVGDQDLSNEAVSSSTAYLHAFPYPVLPRIATNWRLVANVVPDSLDDAVEIGCDVLDNTPQMDEFKISAPGFVGKPDSLIFYMLNTNATYAGIRNGLVPRLQGLGIQTTSAPMVNELAAGIAECSEPPSILYDGNGVFQFSFGTFRCFLTAMAYQTALATAGNLANLTQVAFAQEVDDTFDTYGVPHLTPHRQNANNYVNGDAEYTAFTNALDEYNGVNQGTFAGLHAAFNNPPAIL